MKGFLKSCEGVFQLAPKVTTVGRDGCDLVVQSNGVDYQHAVIEYQSEENCFVLQDLNTAHGSFVNDCRIQNAAVRLAPGDIIRFGCSTTMYELAVETQEQIACPPVHQRATWATPQQLTFLHEENQPPYSESSGLPHLQNANTTKSSTTSWSQTQAHLPVPRPPGVSVRARPFSASNIQSRRVTTITSEVQPSPPTQRAVIGSGWVSVTNNTARVVVPGTTGVVANDVMNMQEKEQRFLRLQEEMKRLSNFEHECMRKEDVIQTLREENADLQGRIRQLETSRGVIEVTGDNDLVQKIMQLESELNLKRTEASSLKEQINRMKTTTVQITESNGFSRQESNDRIHELNSLRSELERVKKDKNITSGLVTQMQRDMTSKDTTISRLTREIESLKTEIKEKDNQLLSMQTKMEVEFKRIEESRKTEDEVDAKNKELMAIKLKLKTSENHSKEQSDLVSSLKEELEKVKKTVENDKENAKHVSQEVSQLKTKCVDLERSERLVRVDLEQVSKKLERFRQRVVQLTFSTPGIKAPDSEIDDDALLGTFKTIVDERTNLMQQIRDMKDQVNSVSAGKKEVAENTKKLKQQLNESLSRLAGKSHKASLIKQEIDMIGCLTLDESSGWLRDILLKLFHLQHSLVHELETSLEECGINVKISDDTPSKHIQYLKQQGQELKDEKMALVQELAGHNEKYQAEMETKITAIRAEMTAESTAKVEKVKLENEEHFNRMIEEIKSLETEKRENAIQMEREKLAVMEADLGQLKSALLEKEETNSQHKEVYEQIEVYQKLEVELREQIKSMESGDSETVSNMKKELEDWNMKFESHVSSYKEQIRQHSVTICTMEERLNKVMKKNKDYQAEITQLKHNLQDTSTLEDAKNKPKSAIPPKPKIIVQKPAAEILAIETQVTEFRRENSKLKQQATEQQAVITGLRRDLAGASARLTDVTGEVTETQKQQVERFKMEAKSKEAELIELRQQMVKLSEIVDKQKAEIKQLNSEISQQKKSLSKLSSSQMDKESKLRELKDKVTIEQEQQRQKMDMIQQEGRITSELSAVGAQCRGDRHDQVIARQREALTELRTRIKILEQMHPQVPSHDQALQQVILLKKELSELRSAQVARDTNISQLIDANVLSNQVSRARGVSAQDRAEVDMEKSAHRQTVETLELSETSPGPVSEGFGSMASSVYSASYSRPSSHQGRLQHSPPVRDPGPKPARKLGKRSPQAASCSDIPTLKYTQSPAAMAVSSLERNDEIMNLLELSETSYLTLLRAISSSLEMENVGGLRSMAHIPRDERRHLATEREQACEVLANRINVMKDRINRKDELLHGYERDLAKLRQTEILAETRNTQVHSLSEDVRSRAEETQYLRESLSRTRDRLDQEKRLNSNIKSKKTFHLENERTAEKVYKTSHCEYEDVIGKNAAKKKAQAERTRRRNYEIKVLKEELGSRDRNLSDTKRRLHALQSSIGLESPSGIMEAP